MNLIDCVYRNARLYPDETAFVEVRPVSKVKLRRSWKEFNEQTNRLASELIRRGIKKGDRVLLLGRNSMDWLVAYFGIAKTGAWVTPLNFRFTSEDIEFCANTAEPAAFLFDAEFMPVVEPIKDKLSSVKLYVSMGDERLEGAEMMKGLIEGGSPDFIGAVPKDEDEIGLYFTSGTTGKPKPILLLHKNFFGTAVNEVTNLLLTKGDTLLQIPPLYHVAMGHLLGSMLMAAKTVLLTEQVTAHSILDTIDQERLTRVFLLVPWGLDILEALDKGAIKKEAYHLDQLRIIEMGAQPIPTSLVKRWKEYFPHMRFHNTYGLSETAGPGTIHCSDEAKIGAIGKPGLLWDGRIVDQNDNDVPAGGVGEIIVKGMGVMKEYYRNPEMTAVTMLGGWLHTGDLGRVDEEGFFYLVDRKKDLVISGGENIFPVEVEEVIQRHPKVRDVAVIGTPDARLGETVTAVIEPVAGEILTEEEMKRFCDENLPRYKRPRRIIFDAVPRSSTGKLEKPKLREKYGQSPSA